jgi:hypothetical protein
VAVPGIFRLLLEIDILVGAGVVAIIVWNVVMGALVVVGAIVHYLGTRRRVRWLISQRMIR